MQFSKKRLLILLPEDVLILGRVRLMLYSGWATLLRHKQREYVLNVISPLQTFNLSNKIK